MKHSLTIFGTVTLLLSVTVALADPLVMQCNKAHCMRSRCDEWGENCRPAGYFERSNGQYAVPQSKQVCNEFGDCHFAPPSFPPVAATKTPIPAPVAPALVVATPSPVIVPK